jgi:hypothetical protein
MPYPDDGVLLGNGWITSSNRKAPGVCIAFAEAQDTGQDTTLDLTNIIDNSQLSHEMNVSASFEFNAAVTKASAKVTFYQKTQIQDDRDYFLAKAQALNGAHYVIPPGASDTSSQNGGNTTNTVIKPGLWDTRMAAGNGSQVDLVPQAATLANSDPSGFLKQCGDGFVSAIHSGAELLAQLQIDQHSVDDRLKLSGKLEGSYSGASLTAEADDTLATLQKSQQIKILYYKSGGSGDPLPIDKNGVADAIKNVAAAAKSSPRPFLVTVQQYDTLPSWPTNAPSFYSDLQRMMEKYEELKTLHSQIEYVKTHEGEFILNRGTDIPQLKAIQDTLKAHLGSIEKQVQNCFQSPAQSCRLDSADDLPDYQFRILMPVRPGSFDADTQLAQLQKTDVELKQKLTQLEQDRYEIAGNNPITGPLADWISGTKSQIADTDKLLSQAQAAYPAALKDAIASQWIYYPNSVRCRTLSLPSCITNKDADDWVSRIVTK